MGSKGCHIPAPAPVVLKDGKKKKASFERAAREVEKNQTSFQGRREPQRGWDREVLCLQMTNHVFQREMLKSFKEHKGVG